MRFYKVVFWFCIEILFNNSRVNWLVGLFIRSRPHRFRDVPHHWDAKLRLSTLSTRRRLVYCVFFILKSRNKEMKFRGDNISLWVYCWTPVQRTQSTVELQYKEHSLLLNSSTKNTVYCWTSVQRTQSIVELQYKEHSLLLNSSIKNTVYCWTSVQEHSLLLNFSTKNTVYCWTSVQSTQSTVELQYKNTVYCWTSVQSTQSTVELQYKEHSLLLNFSTKNTVYRWTPV